MRVRWKLCNVCKCIGIFRHYVLLSLNILDHVCGCVHTRNIDEKWVKMDEMKKKKEKLFSHSLNFSHTIFHHTWRNFFYCCSFFFFFLFSVFFSFPFLFILVWFQHWSFSRRHTHTYRVCVCALTFSNTENKMYIYVIRNVCHFGYAFQFQYFNFNSSFAIFPFFSISFSTFSCNFHLILICLKSLFAYLLFRKYLIHFIAVKAKSWCWLLSLRESCSVISFSF